ncbi:MAG: radical SAM protein, partial [Chromatiales bacterium]
MTSSSHASALIDPFGRRVEYVRLSVTDKCNMRCFYCIPQGFTDFEEPKNWLTFEEIERFIAAFASLGVRRLRLTGGEPLVRRNLPELAANLSAIDGIEDLSLSTNAALLRQHAGALKQAGISRINVSLDSLDPDRFRQITRGDLEQVLDGLM